MTQAHLSGRLLLALLLGGVAATAAAYHFIINVDLNRAVEISGTVARAGNAQKRIEVSEWAVDGTGPPATLPAMMREADAVLLGTYRERVRIRDAASFLAELRKVG